MLCKPLVKKDKYGLNKVTINWKMINEGENLMNWDKHFQEINLKFKEDKVIKQYVKY